MSVTDPNPAREADGQTDREAPEGLVDVLFDLGSPFFSSNNDEMGNFIGHARKRLLDPANRDTVLRALGMREERVGSADARTPYNAPARRFVSEWEADR